MHHWKDSDEAVPHVWREWETLGSTVSSNVTAELKDMLAAGKGARVSANVTTMPTHPSLVVNPVGCVIQWHLSTVESRPERVQHRA